LTNVQSINFYSSTPKKPSRLTKLYIWSIMLEPLLFFVVGGSFFGVSTNISRVLQLLFLVALVSKLVLLNRDWFIPSPFSTKYRWYSFYFVASIISGIYGSLIGAYEIPFLPRDETVFVRAYRPLFEYFVTIYYFCYFVVLARYVVSSPQALNYYFSVFSKIFFFSLFIGLIDVFIQVIASDYGGIPRHIGQGGTAPMRFHGIAGEPRDAFSFLVFGVGILWVKDVWRNEKKLTKSVLFYIVIAAFLSQSASGLLGLVFSSLILLVFYYVPKMSLKKLLRLILLIFLILSILVVGVMYSPRLVLYYEASKDLYDVLDSGNQVTSILMVAMNNIYPLWVRWTEILELNLIPLFVGTGLGSSSVANVIYFAENELQNTNSNLVRTFFENGIIGTLILTMAFLKPIKSLRLPIIIRNKWFVCMVFIVGAFFAHRSAAPFIFLGVTYAVVSQISLRYSSK
jgi:hypothetical protein